MFIFCIFVLPSILAIPQTFNIHGKLTDDSGVPVSVATNINFSVYSVTSGGSALYSSLKSVTPDTEGIYDVILDLSGLDFKSQYFLGIKVGTDLEMTPRINLTTSPYAFRAQNVSIAGVEFDSEVNIGAQNLLTTGNITADYFMGDGSLLTNIDSSAVSYWTMTGTNLSYSGGNVGIGTGTPDTSFHIYDDSINQLNFWHTDSARSRLSLGRGYDSSSRFELSYNSGGTENAYISRYYSGAKLHFDMNGVDHMVIDASGNVGIGTAAPATKLQITNTDGGELINQLVLQNSNTTTGTGTQLRFVSTTGITAENGITNLNSVRQSDGSVDFTIQMSPGSAVDPTDKLTIDGSSGNVGIGTTSPNKTLDVSTLLNTTFRLTSTKDSNDWVIGDTVGKIEFYGEDSSSQQDGIRGFIKSINEEDSYGQHWGMSFGTTRYNADASEKMRITDDGKVGIGTSDPSEALDVVGNITASDDICIDGGACLSTVAGAAGDYVLKSGDTMTGDLNMNYYSSNSRAITFDGAVDAGIDMAIRGTAEGLDFYEPEDGNKVHMRIVDDVGVNAIFGIRTGTGDGTVRIDGSGVGTLTGLTMTGNIAMGTNKITGLGNGSAAQDAVTKSQLDAVSVGAADSYVVGPASSTDNAIARFDSTTGKIVQDSGVTVADNGQISSGNFVQYKPLTWQENVGDQVWLLVNNSRGTNEVLGTLYGHRSSGNYQASIVDILVTTANDVDTKRGYINTKQGVQNDEKWSLVTVTYSGDNYIALRYQSANPYPFTEVWFDGLIKSELSANILKSLPTSSVTDVTAFDTSNTRQTIGAASVGIGTNSPDAKLEVDKGTAAAASSTGATTLTNSALALDASSTTSTKLMFGVGSAAYTWIQAQNNDNSVKYLSLNPVGGNVGIGTINPGEALDVVGNITASGDICANGACLSDAVAGTSQWTTTGSDIYYNDGNVGIGTATPDQGLSVEDFMSFQNSGGNRITVGYNSSTGYGEYYGLNDLGGLKFGFASNKNVLVLDNDSNIGIGTSTPGEALDVIGNINATGDVCLDSGECLSTVAGAAGDYVLKTGDTMTGRLTHLSDDGLYIKTSTNAIGATINFSDNIAGYTQNGWIQYKHADGAVAVGSNDGFIIGGTEANTVVRIDGRLDVEGNLTLLNGAMINEFSTDTALAGNSDLAVPTEKAVKAYVDSAAGSGLDGSGAANKAAFWSDADTLTYDGNFTWDNTNKRLGLGVSDPTTLLQLSNDGWISAKNAAGDGVVNMFKVNSENQIEVGAALNIGSFEFAADSGLVTFADMPVTADASAGDSESYVFKVDGDNIMTVYSEADGSGGVQNKRVGIGTITPKNALNVIGDANFTGAVYATTLDTGQGANELYDMNQNVLTTSSPTFAGLTMTGNVAMGGNKITGLGNGTAATDAVTKAQLDAVSSVVSGDYVPYTGADANVVLGNNNFSVGGSDLFVDTNNARVGIGTTNPIGQLHLYDETAGAGMYFDSPGTDQYKMYFQETASMFSFFFDGNSVSGDNNLLHIRSEVSGSEDNLMTFRGDGKVGINQTSPEAAMHVTGDVIIEI